MSKVNWISTFDRLPEKYQDVLIYFGAGNMAVGFCVMGMKTQLFGVHIQMMDGMQIAILSRHFG